MSSKTTKETTVAPTTQGQSGKKKSGENINARLQLVIKSGKYSLGYKETMRNLRLAKAKLVVVANNIPPIRKSEIEYYSMLSHADIYFYPGNNVELGTACGKYHGVGVMTVQDAGDSDIIRAVKLMQSQ
ncbi:hypothetical protein ABK040_005896 [Willaertia magna]